MRTTSLAWAALLFLGACAAIQANPDESVEQVERRRFAAMVAQDLAALEPLLAEDLTYGHSNGAFENKSEFLETIREGRLRYEAIGVQELAVRQYGNVAIVTGRILISGRAGTGPVMLNLRYTDAYVKRDGRWQLVAWQSTRLPQE
ncbi:MAG TPA: nuclear transport factor 2 family protein [Steroidobacteraceae bacterium]|nr:nuclear transport factor 2 family protein [Steroidobacteraceae bacterium]